MPKPTKKRVKRNISIMSDLHKNKKISEIAREHGLSPDQVGRIVRPTKTKMKEERDSSIYSDYMKGKSVREIAKKYNLTDEHVKHMIGKEYINRQKRK